MTRSPSITALLSFWVLLCNVSSVISSSMTIAGTTFTTIDLKDAPNTTTTCTSQNMRIRKEWRRMSAHERLDYLTAVQCLHEKPAQTSKFFAGVHSRYDDFVALHVNASATAGGIHNIGVFFPWHRLTVWIYENILRTECGYTGTQPYWDYTLDTPEKGGSFNSSPIFDPVTGFGGDGVPEPGKTNRKGMCMPTVVCGSCIADGPFAKYKIYLGPGNSMKSNPRCLTRAIDAAGGERAASARNLASLMSKSTYKAFENMDTGGFHGLGHTGVGGEMTNPFTSTNDPLFWMHHTEMDRLWSLWQGNNETRLKDLAGPVGMSFGSLFGSGRSGSKAPSQTSQQTMIWMGQFPPSMPIGNVADTQNRDGAGVLCYKYDQ